MWRQRLANEYKTIYKPRPQEPKWIQFQKRSRVRKLNFLPAPVTKITINFLAPNGHEYFHEHYLQKIKPLEDQDFYDCIDGAIERYGLDIYLDEDSE